MFSTAAWIIIGALATTVGAMAGWIKYRERALGKVIAAKDALVISKDTVIAALNKRIDELQEERLRVAQNTIADMEAARDALKGGQGDSSR